MALCNVGERWPAAWRGPLLSIEVTPGPDNATLALRARRASTSPRDSRRASRWARISARR
jgi:hypothetical protein